MRDLPANKVPSSSQAWQRRLYLAPWHADYPQDFRDWNRGIQLIDIHHDHPLGLILGLEATIGAKVEHGCHAAMPVEDPANVAWGVWHIRDLLGRHYLADVHDRDGEVVVANP